ncbi:hypothetical protein NGM37_00535, partial [Streptomyces sp. TRM76130]|nr:hypothetical protein [Streptomyces sp. TRM76130]
VAAHRRRRRRTLLVTAGFLLATGGLSLTELGSADGAGTPSSQPATSGEDAPGSDRENDAEPSPEATVVQVGDATSAGATDSATPRPSGSKSADPRPSGSSEATDSGARAEDASAHPAASRTA